MLSNAYFLAKFRFDTAENEPAKNLQNFRKMHFSKMQRTCSVPLRWCRTAPGWPTASSTAAARTSPTRPRICRCSVFRAGKCIFAGKAHFRREKCVFVTEKLAKIWMARSRLYRSRFFLDAKMRFATFFKIYSRPYRAKKSASTFLSPEKKDTFGGEPPSGAP